MKIKALLTKLQGLKSPLERDPDIPDDQTTDKHLRALRRQRRVQLEEFEKQRLIEQINAHNRMRDAESINGNGKSMLAPSLPVKRPVKKDTSFYGRGGFL